MRSAGWLACAAVALSGAMVARATPPPPEYVNDAAIMGDGMPRLLSDYGFFDDPGAQVPVAGVHPYRLNTPLYSDGAEKMRFVYRAAGTQFTAQGDGLLDLPVGTALIKTFAFGPGSDRRPIETRVLPPRADGRLALL